MNAINPLQPPPTRGHEQRTSEPSMEEILASIRRIIADDQTVPARTSPLDAPPLGREMGDRPSFGAVLRESESRLHPEGEKAEASIDPVPPPHVVEVPDAVRGAVTAHGHVSAPQYPTPHTPLSRPVVRAATQSSQMSPPIERPAPELRQAAPSTQDDEFGLDSQMGHEREPPKPATELFSTNTGQSVSSAFNVLAAARFADNADELLGLAREMIRPLLKTWLDDNLPSMVERMVRAEIERVARGGR